MSKNTIKRPGPPRPRTARKKAGSSTPTKAEQDALVALFNTGRLAEGEMAARGLTERYPNAAFGWKALGTVLLADDRHQEALPALQSAVARAPRDVECINSLGKTLQDLGRTEEALDWLTRAASINPRNASVQINQGNVLAQLGRDEEGLACLARALAIRPDSTIALNDQGNILKALGRPAEALVCCERALAINPGFAQAHNNLGSVLQELGRLQDALGHYQRALELKPDFDIAKSNYAHCVKRMRFQQDDPDMRARVTRALRESWCRPGELMGVCCDFIKMNSIIRQAIQRIDAAGPTTFSIQGVSCQGLLESSSIKALVDDALLMSLLESAPVCDVALEHLLTCIRRTMLTDTALDAVTEPLAASRLRLFSAVATQCYLNEYVFAVTDAENARAETLREEVTAALGDEAPLSAWLLLAVAAYFPLNSLPAADRLLDHPWPPPLMEVVIQQVREPMQEAEYRDGMSSLTDIDSGISALVRKQYEENPYPRWVKAASVPQRLSINAFVRQQFPLAPFFRLRRQYKDIDILIAGCGTGRHSLDTARHFANSRVLAIDLSRSSLGYAQRKTVELGVTNVRYAQADILRLDELDAQFDLIESVGVLHHLQDPIAGWKILLSRLRPDGCMSLGLYSERARRPISVARALIAEKGYGATASDIRRCRQELMGHNRPEYGQIASGADFFTLSGCRDLLFHVQEHRFTLPRLAELLREFNLNFLGFIIDHDVIASYVKHFPDDPSATNLDHWDRFEAENPTTFSGMYQFWVWKNSDPCQTPSRR